MKWDTVFKEEDKLKRKTELITIYNVVDVIFRIAGTARDFNDFVGSLSVLLKKIEEEINSI